MVLFITSVLFSCLEQAVNLKLTDSSKCKVTLPEYFEGSNRHRRKGINSEFEF